MGGADEELVVEEEGLAPGFWSGDARDGLLGVEMICLTSFLTHLILAKSGQII